LFDHPQQNIDFRPQTNIASSLHILVVWSEHCGVKAATHPLSPKFSTSIADIHLFHGRRKQFFNRGNVRTGDDMAVNDKKGRSFYAESQPLIPVDLHQGSHLGALTGLQGFFVKLAAEGLLIGPNTVSRAEDMLNLIRRCLGEGKEKDITGHILLCGQYLEGLAAV